MPTLLEAAQSVLDAIDEGNVFETSHDKWFEGSRLADELRDAIADASDEPDFRAALVGLVGTDERQELLEIHAATVSTFGNDPEAACMLVAINALLQGHPAT
jgi:hypothetical protein